MALGLGTEIEIRVRVSDMVRGRGTPAVGAIDEHVLLLARGGVWAGCGVELGVEAGFVVGVGLGVGVPGPGAGRCGDGPPSAAMGVEEARFTCMLAACCPACEIWGDMGRCGEREGHRENTEAHAVDAADCASRQGAHAGE